MGKYHFKSRVRFSECDENGKLTLYSLLNYLQDCATFHGEDADIGFEHNKPLGLAWIVTDMQLLARRYPAFKEEITVNTWCDRFHGYIGHRCFSVEDAAGREIVLAASDWVFMNMKKQEPARVTEDQIQGYGVCPELAIAEDLGKRKVRLPEKLSDRGSLTARADGRKYEPVVIREEDLDTNHHVNNAQYVRMASRFLPEGFAPVRFRAEWKKQSMLHDILIPGAAVYDSRHYVEFMSPSGETVFVCEAQ